MLKARRNTVAGRGMTDMTNSMASELRLQEDNPLNAPVTN